MARLVDPDGYVFLTISRLQSLECPRRGRWYMDRPDGPPATSAVVGRAGHLVLATLGKSDWPEDAFDTLPELVDHALTREGLRFLVPSDEYYRERSVLVEALRRFVGTWPLRQARPAWCAHRARGRGPSRRLEARQVPR
jgi:hypothetical protein